ncbi:MAG TPA: hypothetical protein DDW89_09840 [Gammaproteobacteria bacterium]|nr:hypothetical protein [Gammaproteobacteria bacterium]
MNGDIIVFDLDGTIADCSHRLHHIKGTVKDWEAFHAACHADAPIMPVIRLMEALYEAHHPVEIWTGRDDTTAEATRRWLQDWGKIYGHGIPIRMRQHGDHTEDHILKARWLADLRATGRDVAMAFEDRARVVKMWRAHGVQCFQVCEGDF